MLFVAPVCCTDDKHVLLATHSVHLGQQLIDDAVSRASTISDTAAAGLGN